MKAESSAGGEGEGEGMSGLCSYLGGVGIIEGVHDRILVCPSAHGKEL